LERFAALLVFFAVNGDLGVGAAWPGDMLMFLRPVFYAVSGLDDATSKR
jgi:hypothetical protein